MAEQHPTAPAFEIEAKSLGVNVDDALNHMRELQKMTIFANGGTCENLVLGLTVSLFKEVETETTESLDLVSEPITFVLKYSDDRVAKVAHDADGRVGELAYSIVSGFLEQLQATMIEWGKKLESEKNGS